MMKKVLSVLIFLLALVLPCFGAQDQQQPQTTPPASTTSDNAAQAQPEPAREQPTPTLERQQQQTAAPQQQAEQPKVEQPKATPSPAPEPSPEATLVNPSSSSSKVKSDATASVAAPDAPDFYKIGLAHYESKQFKDAVEAFKRALRLKPNDPDIHYNLGLAYYSSNLYREASKSYEQAARLRPDWADAHFRLGWMYYILGKKDASFEQYKILQKLNSEQAATLYRIIKVEKSNATASTAKEAKEAKESKSGAKAAAAASQPDAKEESRVESRLVVADNAQPAPRADAPSSTSAASAPTAANASPAANNAAPNDTTNNNAAANNATRSNATSASTPASTHASMTPAANATSTASTTPSAASTSPASPAPATAVEAATAAATSDEASLVKTYRVGVGDVLDIRLANTPTTRSTLYTVMDGGLIEYPLAGGPVNVSGLTTEEINARLSTELKRRAVNQGSNEMLVSVRDYVSHNVVISGLVNNPGTRILHREAVPLYVVLADAQPRTDASRVLIMRASGQVQVDLSDPAQMNVLVRPGDVINVSARPPQFYYLGGKIMTPGQKSFQPGITLVQAILAAGGLERGSSDVVEVSREGEDGRLTTTRYKLKEIRSGKIPDPRLQPGDRIEVGR